MDCSPESLFSFAIKDFKSRTYENVIFYLLLYMDVPLKSLPFMEECRLRVVRNWTMRNIFGPKLVQEAREWINLHNEDFSPNFVQND